MVARGEYQIYPGATEDSMAPQVAAGAPLKAIALEEGTAVSPSTILVLKGAPHPSASKVFVNWLLSPDGQHTYAESASSTTLRKDVPGFLHPNATVNPVKVLPITWELTDWVDKDVEAKTMEGIWGKK